MLTCWSYNPEMRPPFHTILENLETFKEKSLDPASDFYNKRKSNRDKDMYRIFSKYGPGINYFQMASDQALIEPGILLKYKKQCNKL